MNTSERMLLIKLIDQIKESPDIAEELGIRLFDPKGNEKTKPSAISEPIMYQG